MIVFLNFCVFFVVLFILRCPVYALILNLPLQLQIDDQHFEDANEIAHKPTVVITGTYVGAAITWLEIELSLLINRMVLLWLRQLLGLLADRFISHSSRGCSKIDDDERSALARAVAYASLAVNGAAADDLDSMKLHTVDRGVLQGHALLLPQRNYGQDQ